MAKYAYLELGGVKVYLPYNPNTVYWNYDLNRQVIDTYGGRVVQLLSVSTSSMLVQGDAGSRRKLLQLYSDYRGMQDLQIENKQSATLFIPAEFAEKGSITHSVWLASMDVAITKQTVVYPYRITLEVQEDNSDFVANTIKDLAADFNYMKKNGVGFINNGRAQGISGAKISLGQLSQYVYGKSKL